MPVAVLALRGCPLFAQAAEPVLEFASRQMEIVVLKRRQALLPGGLPFRGLGLVLQGRLQAIDTTLDGREVALATIEPGQAFGEANLLASRPVDTTWVAVAPATLAVMDRQPAQELLRESDICMQVAAGMAQQLCDGVGWQKVLSVHPVSARVCAWLLWSAGVGGEAAPVPVPVLTHAELAWRLNTTRESITRILQRLQTEEVIGREGDCWRVLAPEVLRELAAGEPRPGPG